MRSGSEIVPPAFTEVTTLPIDASITALPAVLPVMSIAWRIGTPAVVSEDSVRDQRAMHTFWTTSPIFIGIRSLNASHRGRPNFERFQQMKRRDQRDEHDDHHVPLLGQQMREVDHELAERRQLLPGNCLNTPSKTGIRNATSASSTVTAKVITSAG